MTSAVWFMTFALTFAGAVQVQMQRVMGESYMVVQDYLTLFYEMRLGAGVFVLIGALMFVYALWGPARVQKPARMDVALQPGK